jgi:hypothetical protein
MPDRNTPHIRPQLENSGDGNTTVFEKDDLVIPVRKTLGDYLASKTAKNEFAIKEGSTPFKLHNSDGTPADLPVQDQNAKKTYMDTFDPSSGVRAEFQKYSNSGYLDTKSSPFVIKKGVSNKPLPSGEDLIREVDTKLDKASFVGRVQEVIETSNRFNVDSPFIPRNGIGNNGHEENDSNIGISVVQKEFGVHYPRKDLNAAVKAGLASEAPVLLKIKELKKLGALTMLRASGEVYTPNDPNNAIQDLAARGSTLVPGLARVGQKVPSSRFSAKNIIGDVDPNFKRPDLNNSLETKEVFSYGNVNNYLVPFAGLSSNSSVIAAGLLSTVVVAMIRAIATGILARKQTNVLRHPGTLTNLIGGNLNEETVSKRKKNKLGSYLTKAFLTELDIDTVNTYHDYFRCVDRGTSIFFGMDSSILSVQSVTNGISNIAKNHGFYNVILRNLIRSATDDFINAFGISLGSIAPQVQFGTANRGFAIEDTGTIGAPLDPIALVKKLNNSALLKFINILATIGDNALLLDKQGYNTSNVGGFDITEVSDIDKIAGISPEGEINISTIHSKDRLSDRVNTLAWSSYTAPSLYWFPTEILSGSVTYFGSTNNGVFKAMGGIQGTIKSDSSANGRISAEDVKELEDKLDAQYMPFYFHDLRTNEIISFHAFLDDISDGFTAEYEESDGYGRIGKVLTYKNTDRAISLSFRAVATSPEDFDQMWWKINKLVTLVYPQYTEGRRLSEGQGGDAKQFIQPFSQLPSASPMIRLRLGDLFKTNYSKFNLARLFGVASPYFKLSQNQNGTSLDPNRINDLQRQIENTKKRMMGLNAREDRFRVNEKAMLKANGQPGVNGTMNAYSKVSNGASIPNVIPQAVFGGDNNSRGLVIYYSARVKIIQKIPNAQAYKVELDSAGPGQDGQFIVNDDDLFIDPEEVTRIALQNSQLNSTDTNQNSPVSNFFSDNSSATGGGNAIFRSFASVQGKGLAGFIRSINFDYNDTTWETERMNARAPMFIKVSIEFAPIHDIAPGIDAYGFNTAPVYNVGNILKSFNKEESSTINQAADQNFSNGRNETGRVRQNNQTGDFSTNTGGGNGIG